MNIYRHQFIAACPGNGSQIIYALEIQSMSMIHVEHITLACKLHNKGYHEAIADDLHNRFGGRQVITAHHHGVDIETIRGNS